MHQSKVPLHTIYDRNNRINAIINELVVGRRFLILGHENPDEDCISSMVAISLILGKFFKEVTVFFSKKPHDHFTYLLNICKYNAIHIATSVNALRNEYDHIIVCDTPKLSMLDAPYELETYRRKLNARIIEFDHHIGGDSTIIGEEKISYIDEASSCCELIGITALKIVKHQEWLEKFQVHEFFTRNLVLSLLSGITGDTKMGKFIKTKKERVYYNLFSHMFNSMLGKDTVKQSNLSNIEEVYDELVSLSRVESACFISMIRKSEVDRNLATVTLTLREVLFNTSECDYDTFVQVTRTVADELAEMSGKVGFVAYIDPPGISKKYQFRMRRSQNYKDLDLRLILELGNYKNGGGHEGAISFRVEKSSRENLQYHVRRIISLTEKCIKDLEDKSLYDTLV